MTGLRLHLHPLVHPWDKRCTVSSATVTDLRTLLLPARRAGNVSKPRKVGRSSSLFFFSHASVITLSLSHSGSNPDEDQIREIIGVDLTTPPPPGLSTSPEDARGGLDTVGTTNDENDRFSPLSGWYSLQKGGWCRQTAAKNNDVLSVSTGSRWSPLIEGSTTPFPWLTDEQEQRLLGSIDGLFEEGSPDIAFSDDDETSIRQPSPAEASSHGLSPPEVSDDDELEGEVNIEHLVRHPISE